MRGVEETVCIACGTAWRIIKETESALSIQLLNRDGAHGSSLTEEGDVLLDSYLEIASRVQAAAEEEYKRLIG